MGKQQISKSKTACGISRRDFLRVSGVTAAGLAAGSNASLSKTMPNSSLNLVIFTIDDSDADSLGCYGCPLQGVTPNIDNLAGKGVRLVKAHTTTSTCQGSRLSLMTGKYPQTNGNVGNFDPIRSNLSTLALQMKKAGYFTAIVQKDPNYVPYEAFQWDRLGLNSFQWDHQSDGYWPGWGSPEAFYNLTRELISDARSVGKPFFLHLNTTDPHRPWPGSIDEITFLNRWSKSTSTRPQPMRPFAKNFSPWEVPIPKYLEDLPGVRVDLAQYFSALHRADLAVGRVLDALKETEEIENTVFIFLADQGASLPTSKQNVYRYSTNIPMIIYWPTVTEPGTVIDDTMISIIDLFPTLIDGLALDPEEGLDGQSFFNRLKTGKGPIRNYVYTSYTYARPGLQVFPMRAVQSREFLYIYNAWFNERLIKPNIEIRYDGHIDPLTGLCWTSMKEAALTDPVIAKRVNFIRDRIPEELYDLRVDPYCLVNLIDDDSHRKMAVSMRQRIEAQMKSTNDLLLNKFLGTGPIPPKWLSWG